MTSTGSAPPPSHTAAYRPPQAPPRFRFSLRSLVLAALASGGGFLLAQHWEPWVKEREIVKGAGELLDAEFAPDGERFLVAGASGGAELYATNGGAPRVLRGATGRVCAFSPQGDLLAAALPDYSVALYAAATGSERARLAGHWNQVAALAFAPDGRRLLSAGLDGTARVWDLPAGTLFRVLTCDSKVYQAVFADGPDAAVTAEWDGFVKFWDLRGDAQGPASTRGPGAFWPLYAPEKRRIVTAEQGGGVRVRDGNTGESLLVLDATVGALAWEYPPLAVSPDGRRILTTHAPLPPRLWDAADGELIGVLLGNPVEAVQQAAFSRDGRSAVTGSDVGVVRVWNLEHLTTSAAFPSLGAPVRSAALAPDGRRMLAAAGNRCELWRRRRSDAPGGFLELPEFWLAAALAGALAWSLVRDMRDFARLSRAAPRVA